MLPARFEAIGPDDIVSLVENKISECKILEYKQSLNVAQDEKRAEFLADVLLFANASGGDIIFGISDKRDEDGKPTGLPGAIAHLQIGNAATEGALIEQIIQSGIEPGIPVVQVKSIEIPDRGLVILIRIGKSWLAPHMVSFKNRTGFFSRNGTGKVQLDVQQIGVAFAAQRSVSERMRAWKADRITKGISGNGPMAPEHPQVLMHLISASALMDEPALPRVFELTGDGPLYKLVYGTAQSTRYNAGGLLLLTRKMRSGGASRLERNSYDVRPGCYCLAGHPDTKHRGGRPLSHISAAHRQFDLASCRASGICILSQRQMEMGGIFRLENRTKRPITPAPLFSFLRFAAFAFENAAGSDLRQPQQDPGFRQNRVRP